MWSPVPESCKLQERDGTSPSPTSRAWGVREFDGASPASTTCINSMRTCVPESCKLQERDGTSPSPTSLAGGVHEVDGASPASTTCINSMRTCVPESCKLQERDGTSPSPTSLAGGVHEVDGASPASTTCINSMRTCRGDPCGRPFRNHASCENGTGQARPLQASPGACTNSDGASPASTTCINSMRTCRGDPCGRPFRNHASCKNGTGQARPLQAAPGACTKSMGRRPPRQRASIRCGRVFRNRASCKNGTGQARPLQAAPGACTNSMGRRPPRQRASTRCGRVGATLVVARSGITQAARTGRDKPVPYKPRRGRARSRWGRRPPRQRASIRCGRVGATLVVARSGITQAARTGRDKPVPYKPRRGRARIRWGVARLDNVHQLDADV